MMNADGRTERRCFKLYDLSLTSSRRRAERRRWRGRGGWEGKKRSANGFTIDGLIAAPLRKTELSRPMERKKERRPAAAAMPLYSCMRDRRGGRRRRNSGQTNPPSLSLSLSSAAAALSLPPSILFCSLPPPSKFRALFSRFWASLVFIRSIFRSNGGRTDGRTDVYHFSADAASDDLLSGSSVGFSFYPAKSRARQIA